mgnify:CR=1 FL=1
MKALRTIAVFFASFFVSVFFSVNIVLALLMVAGLGIGLLTYGYDWKIFLYFLVFTFLFSVEIIKILSLNRKNLLKRLWPHILNVVAGFVWIIFAATGLYNIIFSESEEMLISAYKFTLGLDLWILAYNLPVLIFSAILCRKKYREYLAKVLDKSADK